MVNIPAYNAGRHQTEGEPPTYPKNAQDKRYLILYPEDYQAHGVDPEGNVSILLDVDEAREVKRIVEEIIDDLEDTEDADE